MLHNFITAHIELARQIGKLQARVTALEMRQKQERKIPQLTEGQIIRILLTLAVIMAALGKHITFREAIGLLK